MIWIHEIPVKIFLHYQTQENQASTTTWIVKSVLIIRMPELRNEWNLKPTTINDRVKNQSESTGLHAPLNEDRVDSFFFHFGITYWQFQYVLAPAQLAARALVNHSRSQVFEQKRDCSQSTCPMLCLRKTKTFDKVSLTFAVARAEVHRLAFPRVALRCSALSALKRRTCTRDKKDKALTLKTKHDHELFFLQALFWGICRRGSAETEVYFYYYCQSNQVRRSPITLLQT